MTPRERMLAVLQGRKTDRVPFAQYSGLAAPDEEIWSVVGRENMGIVVWTSVHGQETPNCRFEYENITRDGRGGQRITLHTPEGRLTEERFFEPAFGTAAVSSHFVKEPEDYRVLMSYFRDLNIFKYTDGFIETVQRLGEDGLPLVSIIRTPYQQLWVQWVSLQDLPVHMAMYPEVMEEVFEVMEKVQTRVFETVRDVVRDGVDIPYLDFGDNITAPAIGETYFRRHCVPAYNELAAMLDDTGKDVPIFVHMDGDLKPLWAAIGESAVRGLDSFSPYPDNDTRVSDAILQWPHMRLFMNFPSSIHLREPEEIYRMARTILSEGAHTGRLLIQVSENVPPERWRVSYPEIIRAINDHADATKTVPRT